jgi:hypothetical protein
MNMLDESACAGRCRIAYLLLKRFDHFSNVFCMCWQLSDADGIFSNITACKCFRIFFVMLDLHQKKIKKKNQTQSV